MRFFKHPLDKIDFAVWLILVTSIIDQWYEQRTVNVFLIVSVAYMLLLLVKQGFLIKTINDKVTVPEIRKDLGLGPFPGVWSKTRRINFGMIARWIVYTTFIGILIYWILR